MINNYSLFEHPNAVCMSYIQHMKFSLKLSYIMFTSSCKAVIHAFIPSLFITSSSDSVNKMSHLLKNSGCNKL